MVHLWVAGARSRHEKKDVWRFRLMRTSVCCCLEPNLGRQVLNRAFSEGET